MIISAVTVTQLHDSDMFKFSVAQVLLAAFIGFSPFLQEIDAGFSIDYDNDTFLMDGQPFRYVSGSVHYFRFPAQYWRDRLRKMRAAGLNAVSIYIEWSQHEPAPGQYDFSGDLNITKFLTIAQKEDLYVLLRPGPYICAERDMGGLPFWLLANGSDVYLRSSDVRYTQPVQKWFDVFMPMIEPFLYGNGGPIILVQVENEYGSYKSCDNTYKEWLRDLFSSYIKDNAVLFTTDQPVDLECGSISGVYTTVDFGTDKVAANQFAAQRKYAPKGPLVNSEFYSGWLTHWGEKMAHVETSAIVNSLTEMLDAGANVNFYMFYGGTNFGFTAGANGLDNYYYISDITSYDYNAPITESGDLTEKYYAIKDVLARYLPVKNISVVESDKGDYGQVTLQATASLFSPKVRSALGVVHQDQRPRTFESLGQNFGYLLYETEISEDTTTEQTMRVGKINDFANIYLNGDFVGSLGREFRNHTIKISGANQGDRLSIVVENLGRVNFGIGNNDTKGILSDVTLGGKVLESWNMTSFELKNITPIYDCDSDCNNSQGFVFYTTKLVLNSSDASQEFPLDSYLDVSNLTKGLVFVNGHNLGRYWSTRKPQKTLYVPGVYLNAPPEENVIVVLDENIKNETLTISFTTSPMFS